MVRATLWEGEDGANGKYGDPESSRAGYQYVSAGLNLCSYPLSLSTIPSPSPIYTRLGAYDVNSVENTWKVL
jgi:hypothetical protein